MLTIYLKGMFNENKLSQINVQMTNSLHIMNLKIMFNKDQHVPTISQSGTP